MRQYEGLTPESLGFLLANQERKQTLQSLKAHYSLTQQFNSNPRSNPLEMEILDDEWNAFWAPAYALKDKPVDTWNESDYYMYIALDWCLNYAIIAGLLGE